MLMRCQEVGPKLGAFADKELPAGEHAEVADHVSGCEACALKVRQINTLQGRLRTAVASQAPPLGLETRIRANLGSKPSLWSHSPFPRLAMAALGLVVLTAGLWATVWKPMERQMLSVLGIGASDHVHCTLERKSPPIGQVQRPIDPEYGDLLARVQAAMPKDLQLLESHFCRWQGRRFQHIVFGRDANKVSLIVTPKKGADSFPRLALLASMRAQGIPVYQAHIGQSQTAGFESGHNLAFLVSDLAADENVKLLASLAPAIRDRM